MTRKLVIVNMSNWADEAYRVLTQDGVSDEQAKMLAPGEYAIVNTAHSAATSGRLQGTGMPELRIKESSVGFWRWDEVDRDGKSIANGGTRYRTEAAAKAAYEEAKQVRAEIGGNRSDGLMIYPEKVGEANGYEPPMFPAKAIFDSQEESGDGRRK